MKKKDRKKLNKKKRKRTRRLDARGDRKPSQPVIQGGNVHYELAIYRKLEARKVNLFQWAQTVQYGLHRPSGHKIWSSNLIQPGVRSLLVHVEQPSFLHIDSQHFRGVHV